MNGKIAFSQMEQDAMNVAIEKVRKIQEKSPHNAENVAKKTREVLYDLLTRRPNVTLWLEKNPDFLVQWYENNYGEMLERFRGAVSYVENVAWFQFQCSTRSRDNIAKNSKKWENYKIYHTFHYADLDVHRLEKSFLDLQKKLQEFGEKNAIKISFKIPQTYDAMIVGSDNLVIHTDSGEKIHEVYQIFEAWAKRWGIERLRRDFGRATIGKDSENASFTEIIAMHYAKQLTQYTPEQVVRGAIFASQQNQK